jgi:hypothetical protein
MTIQEATTRIPTMTRPRAAGRLLRTGPRLTFVALALLAFPIARAEVCTTQSGMSDADRTALVTAGLSLATKIQANDAPGLRAATVAEVAKDFGGIQSLVGTTAPKLAGQALAVDQVYLLDATTLKKNADGTDADAQFFCSLNRSTAEVDFLIPGLPAGRYAFAMVDSTPAAGRSPWRLSLLLRQDKGQWLLAGFYPKPLTAAGHDGLWYWNAARDLSKQKQPWNAWLYYQTAQMLLRPADFVLSTHLDKLKTETAAAAPPALSEGVSNDAPLVIKGADGTEYHFTSLGVDDSLGQSSVDIVAHLSAPPLPDPAAARKRNNDAMVALLTAYPELRKPFHGVWIFAEAAGQNAFTTEESMAEIH